MSWTLQLSVLVFHGFITLSAVSQEICDKYGPLGFPFNVSLSNNNIEIDEIIWKHNNTIILKRKNGKYKPGNVGDISAKGSLQLKKLTFEDGGIYEAEVFNKAGQSMTNTYRLCVQEKISKPTVTYQCSSKDATFTCNITDINVKTFQWKNRNIIKGTGNTLTISLKELKETDMFTCTVKNNVGEETSAGVKSTCNEKKSIFPNKLFGFDFWIMVGILAGGGGLVLLLIIITLVCCCRRQRQRRLDEEKEMRLDLLTQTQPPCHPDGHKQRPRPTGGAPPGSTGPRRTPRARERPPPTPKDDEDEEQPPPLPHPRKKGPRPPKQ